MKPLHGLQIAAEEIGANKFRSLLTTLGIIFGVGAVISMLAIGRGAKEEILEQMEKVGVNNIVITPKSEEQEEKEKSKAQTSQGEEKKKPKKSLGLNIGDMHAIARMVPGVRNSSVEIRSKTQAIYKEKHMEAEIVGVNPSFFRMYNLDVYLGYAFTKTHDQKSKKVCVLGRDIAVRLFTSAKPIGKHIKCGNTWLKVIAVLEQQQLAELVSEDLKINSVDKSIFIPVQTFLNYFENRGKITDFRMMMARRDEETKENYIQVDKITIQMDETDKLATTAGLIKRILDKRHYGDEDFDITIPELLLRQENQTRSIFNIVLGAIAGISLLVGGIGIMNIMLASVSERTREIGIRKALGAKRSDIIFQFVSEAAMISILGGTLGIFLGVGISLLVEHSFGIPVIISYLSIIYSFIIAMTVGVLFGYLPARKAAEKEPVESLRYE